MVHAHVGAVVVAGGLGVSGEHRARGHAKHLAAVERHEVDALVPRQPELGIVLWVGAKVLVDGAKLARPHVELEVGHAGGSCWSGAAQFSPGAWRGQERAAALIMSPCFCSS